ncbi:hypothetical protein [Spiribacter onubensis]|uniref:Uncharacterized protein n=1 Tax=Spiribacter onubensis TaxID=3122420 RepID=A0ABV3S6W8_9GAMM
MPTAPVAGASSGVNYESNQQKKRRKGLLNEMPKMEAVQTNESMTSAGRLNDMLKSDSKLMQRAATQANQAANNRGLLNSSMAVGAAQGAMIDRAQPFAMQDSNNLIQNARQDAAAINDQRMLQSSTLADSYLSNQNFQQQGALAEQQAGLQAQMAAQEQAYNIGTMELQSSLQAQRDQRLANIDAEQARLQADLQEAASRNDFNRQQQLTEQSAVLQKERDRLLFEQEQQMTDEQALIQAERDRRLADLEEQQINRNAEIQLQRDNRLASLDQQQTELQAQLNEAAAQNDLRRQEQLNRQSAQIQQERDTLLFEQDLDTTAQEYGLRAEEIALEGEQTMEKLYGTSLANAWGVMGNNITDIVAQSLIEINDIQTNPNIEAKDKTKMIKDIQDARDADVEFQAQLYETFPGTLQNTGVFPSSVG